MDVLSTAQARRIALAAQGFADPRPRGRPDLRALSRVFGRVGLVQIDSVNVLTRAHHLPLFSRLGHYPRELLARASGRHPRRLFEYWAHEASLVPVELQPFLRFRMARAADQAWSGRPELPSRVLAQIRDRGPLTARAIGDDGPRRTDRWGWNWSDVKSALEWMFYTGEVTAARRNGSFERVYDLPERVFPPHVLAAPTPGIEDSCRELVRVAARAHGIGTMQCLRDYFRLGVDQARRAVTELVEEGDLIPVRIDGWRRPAYLHAAARIPRRVRARALVGPFDSVVFERTRTEELFGFRFRLEIYVPAPKRVHGYYVLPFLLGDRLVARVDLKADRGASVLLVRAAYAEQHAPPETGEELAAELTAMADWLGLSGVDVADRGDLARSLQRSLASPP